MAKGNQEKFEYFVKRVGERPTHGYSKFTVSKFADGEPHPVQVYNVDYNETTGIGKCDCPAAQYRQTGSQDKHVQMTIKALASGDVT